MYKKISNKSNLLLLINSFILYVIDNYNSNNILIPLVIRKILFVIILFSLLILLRIIFKNNIGGGDVKMIASIYMYLSLDRLLYSLMIAVITSFIVALYLLLIKKKTKDYKFSFGEFISLGTIITILNY
ncbi:MAG: prepilin peptidase [Clostridia bacterium]|nr:prepilin peptidase [Clostridia bacterium]